VGGICVCPEGKVEKYGRCVQIDVTPSVPVCIGGSIRKGKCVCPKGQKPKRVGANAFQCVTVMVPVVPVIPAVPSVTCSGGNVSGSKCVCPKGTQAKKVGANAFICEPKPGVGILPAPQGVQPQLKIIPKMLQPFCPAGTKWNEQYKKCLPILQ
jgi:hypothetical protein